MGQPMDPIAIRRVLQLVAELPERLVGATGVDNVTVEKNAVLQNTRELVPVKSLMGPGQSLQRLHVERIGVMVSQYHLDPALGTGFSQIAKEALRVMDRAGENPVMGPFEIEDVSVKDKDLRRGSGLNQQLRVPPWTGVMTVQVEIGKGNPVSHLPTMRCQPGRRNRQMPYSPL